MKHIFLIIFSFFVLFSFGLQSFAQDMLDVSVSQETISTTETFTLNIDVAGEDVGQSATNFQIPGVENFDVFSQSRSLSIQSTNGQTESVVRYSIALTPKKIGTFSLGPVVIGEGTGAVRDDRVFSIVVQDDLQTLVPKNSLSQDSISKNISQEEDTGEIRGLRTPNSLIWALFFACIGFGILAFFVFQKILSVKNTHISQDPLPIQITEDTFSDRDFFKDLEEKINNMNSQEFLQIYNMKLREIFLRIGVHFAQTATLAEMKKQVLLKHNPLFHLFEKSYMAEYKLEELSLAAKKEYIDEIYKIYKNYGF